MSVNKLSEKLTVAPAKGPVLYRLLSAGQPHFITGKPMTPAAVGYNGITTIFDEGDGTEKTLVYATGTRPTVNGGTEPVIGRVDWDSTGHFLVKKNQVSLYEFMERDNRNLSNPFRDPATKALYERVDEAAKAKVENDKADLELNAMLYLRDATAAELVRYAKALDINTDREIDLILHDMRVVAKRNPKSFLDNSTSVLMKVRAEVKDAQDLGIITWDAADNKFTWRKEGTDLLIVPRGTERADQLVNFLASDKKGQIAYKEIVKRLAAFTDK